MTSDEGACAGPRKGGVSVSSAEAMGVPQDDLDGLDTSPQFGELVRRVRREGAQLISAPDGEVVVLEAQEYRALKRAQTGESLLEALQACPYPEEDIVPPSASMPVSSDVNL